MCCVPTCRPVVDRCLDPVVVRGGGLAHTQATEYHDSQPMGCQPSGSRVATPYGAGWRVYPCWMRKVSWRPSVKQATVLARRVPSQCVRDVKPEPACLLRGRRGLTTTI